MIVQLYLSCLNRQYAFESHWSYKKYFKLVLNFQNLILYLKCKVIDKSGKICKKYTECEYGY